MTEKQNPSIFPQKMQILSGSALKLIAVIVMFIDHYSAHILRYIPLGGRKLFTLAGKSYAVYTVGRDIGRIAFPIFVFLLVEGFIHTHNRLLYARNLAIFALISEIPWNYVHSGNMQYDKQNVYFTLLLGFLGMWVIEYFWENRALQFAGLLALFIVAYFLKADYGWKGYIFCLLMYLLRNERASQAIVGSCWLYYEWKACFAFIPINMYNGKRGFVKSRILKYAFYIFYPAHLLILGYIRFHFLAK